MEELSGSSYSPSISGSEGKHEHEISFRSTRSYCSQMSISSQGSAKDITDVVVRKHRKGSTRLNKRDHLAKARKLRKLTVNRTVTTTCITNKLPEPQMPVVTSDSNILMDMGSCNRF